MTSVKVIIPQVQQVVRDHYQYLKSQDYKGWDVFDGLNSRLFRHSPLNYWSLARLAWIQLFKRSPINLRKLTGVPEGDNPKALALFISALLNWHNVEPSEQFLNDIYRLEKRLMHYSNEAFGGKGWGYNFPWQARAFYVPAYKPNMIVSVFVGHALLDLFQWSSLPHYLEIAEDIATFLTRSLVIINDKQTLCFGYIPGESTIVHNANLLGAAYLARLFSFTQKEIYRDTAQRAVQFSVNAQAADGSWVYGAAHHHQWIDNFHTGYNLWAIYQYQHYTKDQRFEPALIKGVAFHLQHHFTESGLPKYTNTRLYPLDIHCFSQGLITFTELRSFIPDYQQRIVRLVRHVLENMYDKNKKYFFYQRTHKYTIKIPYIRWAQAWMFYAFTRLLKEWGNE